jgi:poly(hydroxyalkanoate) depolymerase family esterase
MLHGCLQTPDDFARGTRMNEAAAPFGAFVLWPAQSAVANPMRCWNWFRPAERRRDAGEAGLLADLVREVMATHPIDPERVYVAGLSAGGAMAAALGAAYPDLFAAVGVHSGVPPALVDGMQSALATMRDGPATGAAASPAKGAAAAAGAAMPPVVAFHGDLDTTVNPSNADGLVGTTRVRAPDTRRPPALERTLRAVRASTRHVRRDARGRVAAELWRVHGVAHAWSGGDAAGTYTDPAGPSATDAMLRFFLERTLHGPAPRLPLREAWRLRGVRVGAAWRRMRRRLVALWRQLAPRAGDTRAARPGANDERDPA